MAPALGSAGGTVASGRPWSFQAGNRCVAVGVDRLLGASNIVMRALPGVVEADPVVLGGISGCEGNPQLVLDPGGLVAAAECGRGATPEEAHPRRAPVLVIDDSLTTRVLEQSILEIGGLRGRSRRLGRGCTHEGSRSSLQPLHRRCRDPVWTASSFVAQNPVRRGFARYPRHPGHLQEWRGGPAARRAGRRSGLLRQGRIRPGTAPANHSNADRVAMAKTRVLVIEDS